MHDDVGMPERPAYDSYTDLDSSRSAIGPALANQILTTVRPWLSKPESRLVVVDVGSGYGATALALGERCLAVTGVEPARHLYDAALGRVTERHQNVRFVHAGVDRLGSLGTADLVVLDNVYEHLQDGPEALRRISSILNDGGVLYLLVPNKLWPIEAHYRLPFLSWLPLLWANRYLRLSGRGHDYEDASYAPTYWQLRSALDACPDLSYEFTLPGDPAATQAGSPLHYRLGMRLLRRAPSLWAISKALLVVAVKRSRTDRGE